MVRYMGQGWADSGTAPVSGCRWTSGRRRSIPPHLGLIWSPVHLEMSPGWHSGDGTTHPASLDGAALGHGSAEPSRLSQRRCHRPGR
ncbi:unnamed protein product [Gadus morhua 'NCC']